MNQTTETNGLALQSCIRQNRRMGDRLFVIVDAARDRNLAFAARNRCGLQMHWLFADNVSENMAGVAPYLVAVDTRTNGAAANYIDIWASQWGSSAGILLFSMADTDALLKHLRHVFRVTDETRKGYYFRFYDPRVLRSFLPACSAGEAQEFFGPVGKILVEGEAPGNVLACELDNGGVKIVERTLGRRAGAPSSRGNGR